MYARFVNEAGGELVRSVYQDPLIRRSPLSTFRPDGRPPGIPRSSATHLPKAPGGRVVGSSPDGDGDERRFAVDRGGLRAGLHRRRPGDPGEGRAEHGRAGSVPAPRRRGGGSPACCLPIRSAPAGYAGDRARPGVRSAPGSGRNGTERRRSGTSCAPPRGKREAPSSNGRWRSDTRRGARRRRPGHASAPAPRSVTSSCRWTRFRTRGRQGSATTWPSWRRRVRHAGHPGARRAEGREGVRPGGRPSGRPERSSGR